MNSNLIAGKTGNEDYVSERPLPYIGHVRVRTNRRIVNVPGGNEIRYVLISHYEQTSVSRRQRQREQESSSLSARKNDRNVVDLRKSHVLGLLPNGDLHAFSGLNRDLQWRARLDLFDDARFGYVHGIQHALNNQTLGLVGRGL